MRKVLTLTLSLALTLQSFCQGNPYAKEYDQTVSDIHLLLNNNKYLDALEQVDLLISKEPDNPYGHFLKGVARMGVNDMTGARKSFQKVKTLGSVSNYNYLNALVSKEYMINMLMEDMGDDSQLDPIRGLKPVIEPKDTLQGALRAERTCFDVSFYDLTVKIIPATRSIEGSNKIYFHTEFNTKKIQIDLFPEFTITNILWNGKSLDFSRNYGAVFIDFGEELKAGDAEEIVIEYNGIPREAPRPPWDGGFVWEKEKGRDYVGVACEQLGASSWWPNKDHLTDKPDSMRINIQVPSGYQAVSNGNLRSTKEAGDGYTNFEWFVSYPINNYNVTFYMGDFVNFNEQVTNAKGSYQVDYYVLPKNLKKAKEYYTQTKEILGVYENLFGEYPFMNDGAGMVEAPYEGMEHQGAIAIGGNYGKGKKRDYWTDDFDYLLIHETGHEWWGNAIAIGDMADAWINEGFTTYSECLFAEEKYGYPSYVKASAYDFRNIVNIWPLVGQRGINENPFLGGDIYNKGAALLNNLRCIIDDDTLFHKILKDYYEQYKFRITTTDDFVNLVNKHTNRVSSDFFNKFLYDSEPPVLLCRFTIKNKQLSFTYMWMNVGRDFEMPFCVAVNDSEYLRLNGTTSLQTFSRDNVKSFFLPNEYRFDEELVPGNSFTYYWTRWPVYDY